MSKKQRRKDLKQPDQFVTKTLSIGQWIREHQRLVVFAAIFIVAAVVLIALTIQLTGSSRNRRSAPLWEAITIASAPIVNPEEEEELSERTKRLLKRVKRYESEDDRREDSIKLFKKVSGDGAVTGQIAKLALASSYYEKGEIAEARGLYEDFYLNPEGFDSLKGIALEGIGFCYEAQKNYDRALEKFRELEQLFDGDFQDIAKYHQARMHEKLNDQDQAAELYRKIVSRSEQATEDMITDGYAQKRAESRLAVLDPTADVLKNRSKSRNADLLKMLGGRGGLGLPGGPGSPPRLPSLPRE